MKSSVISLFRKEMEKDAFFKRFMQSSANKVIKKNVIDRKSLKGRLKGAASGLSTVGLAGVIGTGGVAYGGMTLPPNLSL